MQHPKTKVAVIVIKIQVGKATSLPTSHSLSLSCCLLLKLKPKNSKIYDYLLLQLFFCFLLCLQNSLLLSSTYSSQAHFSFSLAHSLTVPLKWKFIVVFKGFKSFFLASLLLCFFPTGAQKYKMWHSSCLSSCYLPFKGRLKGIRKIFLDMCMLCQ